MKYKYIIIYEFVNTVGSGRCDILHDNKIKSVSDLEKIEDFFVKNRNEKINIKDYKYIGMSWK